jgi:hypothetical protein
MTILESYKTLFIGFLYFFPTIDCHKNHANGDAIKTSIPQPFKILQNPYKHYSTIVGTG